MHILHPTTHVNSIKAVHDQIFLYVSGLSLPGTIYHKKQQLGSIQFIWRKMFLNDVVSTAWNIPEAFPDQPHPIK